jgi:hypothetical protein
LSPGRLSLSHDHDACDLVLGVKHKAVIQIGEDALQSFLKGQVRKGHGDLFLEKGFISPKPDAQLLLDVPCHFEKAVVLKVHGQQAVFDAHRLSTQTILTKEEAENTRNN